MNILNNLVDKAVETTFFRPISSNKYVLSKKIPPKTIELRDGQTFYAEAYFFNRGDMLTNTDDGMTWKRKFTALESHVLLTTKASDIPKAITTCLDMYDLKTSATVLLGIFAMSLGGRAATGSNCPTYSIMSARAAEYANKRDLIQSRLKEIQDLFKDWDDLCKLRISPDDPRYVRHMRKVSETMRSHGITHLFEGREKSTPSGDGKRDPKLAKALEEIDQDAINDYIRSFTTDGVKC